MLTWLRPPRATAREGVMRERDGTPLINSSEYAVWARPPPCGGASRYYHRSPPPPARQDDVLRRGPETPVGVGEASDCQPVTGSQGAAHLGNRALPSIAHCIHDRFVDIAPTGRGQIATTHP